MYETLIAKIKETLAKVTSVKDVFSAPKSKLTKFPAVFFKVNGFSNSFETYGENQAIYRFLMIVIIGISGNTTRETVIDTVLPHVVDDITERFNADWNYGTVDGHRVSVKIDTADAWEISQEEDGEVAYAPLNLEIKLLTNN